MSSAWGRVFFLYGPHEHPQRLVSSVIRSLLAGQPAQMLARAPDPRLPARSGRRRGLVAVLDSDVTAPSTIVRAGDDARESS